MSLQLVFATRNSRKIAEIKGLLKEKMPAVTLRSLLDFPTIELPSISETYSLQKRAEIKAAITAQKTQCFTLADEWGLVIPTLGGEAETVRKKELPNKNLLPDTRALLLSLQGKESLERMAFCECAQALASPEKGVIKSLSARVEGMIAEHECGQSSPEFASVFIKHDYGKTIGQLPARVQDLLSPRRKVFDLMVNTLSSVLVAR